MLDNWLFIGLVVYTLLALFRYKEISEVSAGSALLGFLLTVWLWPVAICTNLHLLYKKIK